MWGSCLQPALKHKSPVSAITWSTLMSLKGPLCSGGDHFIFVGKDKSLFQIFSSACVMMGYYYYSGSLAYFISCCWAFPALYLSPSAVESTRRWCSRKMNAKHTNKHTVTVNTEMTLARHSLRHVRAAISRCISCKLNNNSFKWKTHVGVQDRGLYTICHVTKAASNSVTKH